MDDFHERLNKMILRSGLTQDELSSKSGVSTKTIQNWTRNANPTMPRLDHGVKVAKVLGVPAEYLVTGKAPEGWTPDLSKESLSIAYAAERLDQTGKIEALHLVQSLEQLHPLHSVGAGESSKTAT